MRDPEIEARMEAMSLGLSLVVQVCLWELRVGPWHVMQWHIGQYSSMAALGGGSAKKLTASADRTSQ